MPTVEPRGPARVERARALTGAAVVLAIAAVVSLAVWDEARESAAALADFEREQATLAAAAAGALSGQLDLGPERALAALAGLERPGEALRVFAQAPGDGDAGLRTTDGRVLRCPALARALSEGRTSFRLERPEAAALGLPPRVAVAGVAAVRAAGGTWRAVVVASARRVRDRERRARWRLVLGVTMVGGVLLALGALALRTQRNELLLGQRLALASLRRERDEQLAREGRAATMLTLAAGVAHEVSSPLGVISGRAEMLAEHLASDERSLRAARSIQEQAERIRDVVQGFLRAARGDAPALERVGPGEVLDAAAELVRHRFDHAGVALQVTTGAALPDVRGDARLLEHALVNLLLNACDACARGGRVAVCAREDGRNVVFEVRDDGEGIAPEIAARVLEPFFSTKPTGKGTGLGLAVANEIVKMHRGALALAPRPGGGTEATVRVPVAGGDER